MRLFLIFFFTTITASLSTIKAQHTVKNIPILSIIVNGNTHTKESVIIRELSFKKGYNYLENDLVQFYIPKSVAALKNLNLFNDINIQYSKTDKGFNMRIDVVEKWYLWPIPFVEFADRNLNQWYEYDFHPDRTNIGLYLFKYNLFGLNHTAKATIGKGYTNTLGFEYIAPYVDKNKRIGFEIDVRNKTNQEIQYGLSNNKQLFFKTGAKTMIKQRSASFNLIFRPQIFLRHGLKLSLNVVNVDDTVRTETLNRNYLFDSNNSQRQTSLGYLVTLDRRNNRLLPISGSYLNAGISIHSINPSEHKYVTLNLGAARYLTFENSRFSVALNSRLKLGSESNLPFHLNKILGFDDYVRGYESFVFLGQSMTVGKIELRYHIFREQKVKLKYIPIRSYKEMPVESFVSLFSDYGSAINGDQRTELFGYGLGLNALFYYDKVVRFEYSWNHWNQGGLKIHFKKAF